jgi:hypothetical protein
MPPLNFVIFNLNYRFLFEDTDLWLDIRQLGDIEPTVDDILPSSGAYCGRHTKTDSLAHREC